MFNFYRAVIESVLTFSLIVWFGSSTAQQRSQINNITRVASRIIGHDLPTIDEIYVSRLQKKGLKILKDPLHPARHLCTPLGFTEGMLFVISFHQRMPSPRIPPQFQPWSLVCKV